MNDINFSDLIGKTIIKVSGMEEGSDEITFITTDKKYIMHHYQD